MMCVTSSSLAIILNVLSVIVLEICDSCVGGIEGSADVEGTSEGWLLKLGTPDGSPDKDEGAYDSEGSRLGIELGCSDGIDDGEVLANGIIVVPDEGRDDGSAEG